MSQSPNVMISCKLWWPSLAFPNPQSGKFQVDLCQLSDAAVTALEDMGLSVNNKGDDRQNFITCKSTKKIVPRNPDQSELLVKGRDPINAEDDPERGVVVGNGSTAKCLISPYDWTYNGKKGRSASLRRCIIEDVVEYVPQMEEAL